MFGGCCIASVTCHSETPSKDPIRLITASRRGSAVGSPSTAWDQVASVNYLIGQLTELTQHERYIARGAAVWTPVHFRGLVLTY